MPRKKGNCLPQKEVELDAELIQGAYQRVRGDLVKDPLFIADAEKFEVSVEDLDHRMSKPPPSADQLWNWLDGPDQYRYAGLKVLFSAFGRKDPTIEIDGDAQLSSTTQIIASDVNVRGNLFVDKQGMLMVLGSPRVARFRSRTNFFGTGQLSFQSRSLPAKVNPAMLCVFPHFTPGP